jgi:imidazolonepropionase
MSKVKGGKIALVNIGLLATPLGTRALAGKAQGELQMSRQAYVLMDEGIIIQVGAGEPGADLLQGYEVIDAEGRLVTPGLVDVHTHLVFGGWRAHELKLKLSGVPYLDILAAGGGILSTVRETRAASEEELFHKAAKALDGMMELGTTTCEAKSGYGLNLENELKQLRIVSALNKSHEMDLVSTLMAAHAVPEEYRNDRDGYIKLVIDSIIPAAAKEGLAEYCDVFCETGVFNVQESREILLAGQNAGLKSKIHADEIDAIGGSELAGEIDAVSAEHLIAIRDSSIAALAEGGTIACLLPATSFYLGKPFARARDLVTAGVPIAMGSDFNPGSSPGYSLQFCMNLASHQYRLTPEEILCAVTLNAAAAIGRAGQVGSIEPGKQADMLVWDADDLEFLCYRFGSNLVRTVIKKGRRIIG